MTGSATTFGDHYLVDLHGCNEEVVGDAEHAEEALMTAARRCGATIIKEHFYRFSPHGVSGVILIAESHLSIHTWPEDGFVAVDIFTCGEAMQPEIAIRVLEEAFGAGRVDVMRVTRGDLATE